MTMNVNYPNLTELEVLTPAASGLEDSLRETLSTVSEYAEKGDDPKGILNCVNAAYANCFNIVTALAELGDDYHGSLEDTLSEVEDFASELKNSLNELTWHDMPDDVDITDVEDAVDDVKEFVKTINDVVDGASSTA